MRPLTLQIYWTTYKTHVLLTASHLFSSKHTGFLLHFYNSKCFALQTWGDIEYGFRKPLCHETTFSVLSWHVCYHILVCTTQHNVRQTKHAYLYWSHHGNISAVFWRCIFAFLLSLLQGNSRRNHLSPYFLMSLQLAKRLNALFQLFSSQGITLIPACEAAWRSLILSVLCPRTTAHLRHGLREITCVWRATHCSRWTTHKTGAPELCTSKLETLTDLMLYFYKAQSLQGE